MMPWINWDNNSIKKLLKQIKLYFHKNVFIFLYDKWIKIESY